MNIGVLLVGAGKRGLGTYYPAMAATHDMAVVAIVEERHRAWSLQRSALDVPVFEDLADAVRVVRPDLAVVATPHDTHMPIGIALLRAGVPTLIEKPLVIKATDLALLRRAATDFETPLAPLLSMRNTEFGVAIVDAFGAQHGPAEFVIDVKVPFDPGVHGWRTDRSRSGGGVLIDLGYHYLDLINVCLGTPTIAHALLDSRCAGSRACEREARVLLEYASAGIRVQLLLGAWSKRKSRRRLLVRDGADADTGRWSSVPVVPERASAHAVSDPVLVQIRDLVEAGFLKGQGNWRAALHEQESVLALIESLYRHSDSASEVPCYDR
ncbi:putative dehydrogenase [Nocardia kruczakiae]|uniref:Dehydrogenase n=1 Tax=Nocardia kruczakiae TaxID=261477 RepID=A0ABU1XH38_9NOCA|nr:Gfo/Idh/MocA family oxidoreductase [Nocardia kruczakiae]MDR7169361.1 putative dehydrogenase [Nocardia kruczakiae]